MSDLQSQWEMMEAMQYFDDCVANVPEGATWKVEAGCYVTRIKGRVWCIENNIWRARHKFWHVYDMKSHAMIAEFGTKREALKHLRGGEDE